MTGAKARYFARERSGVVAEADPPRLHHFPRLARALGPARGFCHFTQELPHGETDEPDATGRKHPLQFVVELFFGFFARGDRRGIFRDVTPGRPSPGLCARSAPQHGGGHDTRGDERFHGATSKSFRYR